MDSIEEFIKKSRNVHGDKYDYSKVEYKGSQKDVTIICPIHGEFKQRPANHIRGNTCPECAKEEKRKKLSLSTIDFINKSKEVHGDKYDYTLTEYKNSKTKVEIFCKEHGKFLILPESHISGSGCPKCAGRGLTNEEIIENFKSIHGNFYDYSKVNFSKMHSKITIICPEHGEFEMTPAKHMLGHGCRHCGKKMTKNQFIEKSKETHGEKYDYSLVEFKKVTDKVKIICPEHGEFQIEARQHYRGCGCQKCGYEKLTVLKKHNKDAFIKKAKEIHGDKYDYSKVEYVNNSTKICIICPEHGEFWQTPGNHINNENGCPSCYNNIRKDIKCLTNQEFIEKATLVHGNKYDYSNINYLNSQVKISIRCAKHGYFWQLPHDHLFGHGCPVCGKIESKPENEIYEYIVSILGPENVKKRVRNILPSGKEIDIYVPSKKIGIEYNGLYWHTEDKGKTKHYHLSKTEECENLGIRLIQVFEDEWINDKKLVLKKISHILGIQKSSQKIMARKCSVKEINKETAQEFLTKNHIQGYGLSSIKLGAFYDDKLIGVMTFKNDDGNKWELTRFSTDNNYVSQGIGGKLFSYFVKKYKPDEVKSFADRRWSTNNENLYTKLGFTLKKIIPPDYRYFDGTTMERIHKFRCRKNTLNKKYGLPISMTESEMTRKIGYSKIWDCGLLKYVWKKKEDSN